MRFRLWSRLASRYLRRAEIAVRAGPHVVAGLGRDHELVAEGREILLQQHAERLLGGAVGRPVVVGEVEVRDAEVEGAAHDRAAGLERPVAAEVLPEAERDGRQQQPAAAAAVVESCGRSDRRRVRRSCAASSTRGQATRRYDALRRSGRSAGQARPVTPCPAGRKRVGRLIGAPPERVSSVAAQGRWPTSGASLPLLFVPAYPCFRVRVSDQEQVLPSPAAVSAGR